MTTQNDAPQPNRSSWRDILSVITIQSIMQFAALLFVIVASVGFLYAFIHLLRSSNAEPIKIDEHFGKELFSRHAETVGVVVISILCAFFALRLFSKAGSFTNDVIREKDRKFLEPLITSASKESIDQYIRLASLSGFAGSFQYLGFTGLPLATVGLTLILLLMATLVSDSDLSKGIFDLAKLTLGAFLGSFVQRNLEQEKLILTAGLGAAAGGTGSGAAAGGTGSGTASGGTGST